MVKRLERKVRGKGSCGWANGISDPLKHWIGKSMWMPAALRNRKRRYRLGSNACSDPRCWNGFLDRDTARLCGNVRRPARWQWPCGNARAASSGRCKREASSSCCMKQCNSQDGLTIDVLQRQVHVVRFLVDSNSVSSRCDISLVQCP